MQKISLNAFNELIIENNTGLIVGNGFSINFDKGFANIYSYLKQGIYQLHKNGAFSISPDAKPNTRTVIKQNYNNVLKYIRSLSQKELEEIFIDGIDFARFITTNENIKEFINKSKYIHRLKIGPDMLEIARKIYLVGNTKGFQYVNIEHWPVLIWLYHLIENCNDFKVYKLKNNRFITVLTIGGHKKIVSNQKGDVMARTRFNGFSICYRLLIITIIFRGGKAVELDNLGNKDAINFSKIEAWLQGFEELFSLNYDLILEKVANFPVTYLHGNFQEYQQGYTYFQSYSIRYRNKQYFTNDIMLGDYQTTKVLNPAIQVLVMKNFINEMLPVKTLDMLKNKMTLSKVNHITIYGMHPENDYHILSGIYFNFLTSKIEKPTITFCYYDEKEVEIFIKTWHQVINSVYENKDLLKTISIYFVDSRDVFEQFLI
ncbi:MULTISPECIES: hypothetical protein [Bacillales]|uniref:hypothetical protein n=1 Tax=Bacillales TaxID=1385 RepID=UPI001CFE96A4|nr:hypothetical protein [Pseudalkalibacillus hwajinpoensis]WLR59812.1 hypothetical protein LC071_22345 [Pseudalkalibacillus hwajinpoensis]